MQQQQLNQSLYDRATLPINWTGKKAFTREEWARVMQFLKENPDKTIVDFLQELPNS